MASASFLGVELRFQIDPRVVPWAIAIAGVLAWEPGLAPTRLNRLSDADADGPEPWSEALWPELARRCAEEPGTAWTLTSEKGRASMTWVRRRIQVECSISVPRPRGTAVKHLLALLDALEAGARPALAMAFDSDSRDAAMMTQGLHALDEIPPLLYLDRRALDAIGGDAKLESAPCEIARGRSGAVLVVRPDPFARADREDLNRARRLRRWLGIAPNAPLRVV